MELVKPDPLIIGGRPHYTLTSYDPVAVEVTVPTITEADVESAMQFAIMQEGGGPERMYDDAWIRDKFDGVHGAAELRDTIRRELQAFNEQMVEQQKMSACASALAERLEQRVPAEQIQRTRQAVEQTFYASLAKEGMTIETFIAQSGARMSDVEAMLNQQAQTAAVNEAAVSAWADKFNVQVSDDELRQLTGANDLSQIPEREDLRVSARQIKAMNLLMAECSFTYNHQEIRSQTGPNGTSGDHPHLKLV